MPRKVLYLLKIPTYGKFEKLFESCVYFLKYFTKKIFHNILVALVAIQQVRFTGVFGVSWECSIFSIIILKFTFLVENISIQHSYFPYFVLLKIIKKYSQNSELPLFTFFYFTWVKIIQTLRKVLLIVIGKKKLMAIGAIIGIILKF